MQSRVGSFGVHAVLIAYSLLATLPILLVIMNSFKSHDAIFGSPLSPPNAETFSLVGYAKVLGKSHAGTYFINSMIVTLGSMGLVLLFGAMAAWALTEYKFRGSTLLALFMSIGIMVPIRLGSVAIVSMVRQSGLNDTLTALVLVYAAQGLPMAIFILSEFIEQIPKDLRDAARCLVAAGEPLEAAACYAKGGDHAKAGELFAKAGKPLIAAASLLAASDRAGAARILMMVQRGDADFAQATLALLPLLLEEGLTELVRHVAG